MGMLPPGSVLLEHRLNAGCLATITGRPHHEEGNEHTTTFDFCHFGGDVRLKRLQWLDALLRLPAHRMVHEAVRARHKEPHQELWNCRNTRERVSVV